MNNKHLGPSCDRVIEDIIEKVRRVGAGAGDDPAGSDLNRSPYGHVLSAAASRPTVQAKPVDKGLASGVVFG